MLRLSNIEKRFYIGTPHENQLYQDLNIHIQDGEFITVIGSNGSGKSTFFNIIAGTLQPDQGSILFKGQDIAHLPEHLRSRHIARVYQDPLKGTAPSLTILENLSMAYNKGKKFNLSRGVDQSLLEHFKHELKSLNLGLEDKLNNRVGTLSGGQRQALSLLMATMVQPELLLLDEHTAALDPKTSELIIDLTKRLVSEKEITTVMVTHNLKQALDVGNRLIMFHKGQIVLDLRGEEKRKLSVMDLIAKFNELNLMHELNDSLILG